jgi:hypothetical protein
MLGGSGRRSADRVGELVERGAFLGAPDEVAEKWRVRPFAALVRGDAGKVEQDAYVFVVELEAVGRDAAHPRELIARLGQPLIHEPRC